MGVPEQTANDGDRTNAMVRRSGYQPWVLQALRQRVPERRIGPQALPVI
jgi:hypothetical protein